MRETDAAFNIVHDELRRYQDPQDGALQKGKYGVFGVQPSTYARLAESYLAL